MLVFAQQADALEQRHGMKKKTMVERPQQKVEPRESEGFDEGVSCTIRQQCIRFAQWNDAWGTSIHGISSRKKSRLSSTRRFGAALIALEQPMVAVLVKTSNETCRSRRNFEKTRWRAKLQNARVRAQMPLFRRWHTRTAAGPAGLMDTLNSRQSQGGPLFSRGGELKSSTVSSHMPLR
jgi:hypothetical protein